MVTVERLTNFQLQCQANSLLITTEVGEDVMLDQSIIAFNDEVKALFKGNAKEVRIVSTDSNKNYSCNITLNTIDIVTIHKQKKVYIQIDMSLKCIKINEKIVNSEPLMRFAYMQLKYIIQDSKDLKASMEFISKE